jgi:hypothetical protein
MSPKTSPASRSETPPRGRSDASFWSPETRPRGRDDLSRLGLVDDRPESRDPREALTELGLGDSSPDRRHNLRGVDSVWTTRRIG